jgi:hypothetical protein
VSIKLDLRLPEDTGTFVPLERPISENTELLAEIEHLSSYLYAAVFGWDWQEAAPTCRCSERMYTVKRPYHNSGTTRITFACRGARPYADNGHQWAVTTSPEHHLNTGGRCCGDLRESMEIRP